MLGTFVMTPFPAPARFPTTHWSRVARAGGEPTPEARAALAELCGAYWYPIYALIRRKGHGADEALDLTQDYFARLLENGTVAAADPEKGRFRSFLLADCSFFLADRRDRDRALKRGGGRPVLSIDVRDAEGRFLREPCHDQNPERMFERDWALALIARVFEHLEQFYHRTGRAGLFRRLKPLVSADPDAASRAAVAAELGVTEGNLRVAIHRMRARSAARLRDEVAATLRDAGDDDVADELRALFAILEA
jgi:DNA-directed RNA polymerase specialized sigma24 family protein